MQPLLAAIEERSRVAESAADYWGATATTSAVAMYLRAERDGELTADVAVPLSHLVRAAVAEVRVLAETDPASPGLERRCYIHLTELSLLITIFAHRKCKEYAALCSAQKDFLNAVSSDGVTTVWQLVRPQTIRSRPPVILRETPSDNCEYYTLRKTEPKRRANIDKCKKENSQAPRSEACPSTPARPTTQQAPLSRDGSIAPRVGRAVLSAAPR